MTNTASRVRALRWVARTMAGRALTSAWRLAGAREMEFLEVVVSLASRGTNDVSLQRA
jgi:hypothetical protein